MKIIDNKNLPWIRIVNMPMILTNGNTYFHVAAETGQTEIFEMIFTEDNAVYHL